MSTERDVAHGIPARRSLPSCDVAQVGANGNAALEPRWVEGA